MPLSRSAADAFSIVTISLVAVLALLGLVCIYYSCYFHSRIRKGYAQLRYFNGLWITRIIFIFFAIWWGFGEILRLDFLRRRGRVLNGLDSKWQEAVCKVYIVSNLGFAEPCLFLTVVFLLRASLKNTGSGTVGRRWNFNTTCYVLLYCLPIFVVQLIVILVGRTLMHKKHKLAYLFRVMKMENHSDVRHCTYPLSSTIFLGLFAAVLTTYLFWLGSQILKVVINKNLRKRVCTLILSFSFFFWSRIVLLAVSVLLLPGEFGFRILIFLAFASICCCSAVGAATLVYSPITDSLELRDLLDSQARSIRKQQMHIFSSSHTELSSLVI